jgi:hypothetical protein
MAFKFDISGAPPARDEIAAERDRVEKERDAIQKKLIPFLIAAFVAIILLITFQLTVIVPAVRDPETSPTFLAVVALFMPYMAFILFFIANHFRHKIIENPRKALKVYLMTLDEITPEEQEELIAAPGGGEHDSTVAAYRNRVAALGRRLLRGEVDAIKARERQYNQEEAPASPDR